MAKSDIIDQDNHDIRGALWGLYFETRRRLGFASVNFGDSRILRFTDWQDGAVESNLVRLFIPGAGPLARRDRLQSELNRSLDRRNAKQQSKANGRNGRNPTTCSHHELFLISFVTTHLNPRWLLPVRTSPFPLEPTM